MSRMPLLPVIVLNCGLGAVLCAVDAVVVDASGNATFERQIAAPNILQGSSGVIVTGATTATFGAWHWISGTTADYTITLPTAVGNAGKTIGLRVKDAAVASRTYTVATTSGQFIDGASTAVLQANASLILLSDGVGWSRIGGTASGPALPSGAIVDFASTNVPAGWLLCDGSAVSRTNYALLFAAIGTVYGAGDGSTTFNLPDFRRRVAVGSGGAGTSVLGANVGSYGGEEAHALTIAEMPSHSHAYTFYTRTGYEGGSPIAEAGRSPTNTLNTSAVGGSQAHNIMQPSLVVSKIIKY